VRPFAPLDQDSMNGALHMAARAAGANVESPWSLTNKFFARAFVTCSFRESVPVSLARSVRCLEVYATLRAGWFGKSAAEVKGARRPEVYCQPMFLVRWRVEAAYSLTVCCHTGSPQQARHLLRRHIRRRARQCRRRGRSEEGCAVGWICGSRRARCARSLNVSMA
jgi:hypothetical protein